MDNVIVLYVQCPWCVLNDEQFASTAKAWRKLMGKSISQPECQLCHDTKVVPASKAYDYRTSSRNTDQ